MVAAVSGPAVAKALGVDSGKGHVKATMPTVRGRLWAAGASGEGHCGVAAGDSRSMNREGQVVRRPDRQGTDAAGTGREPS